MKFDVDTKHFINNDEKNDINNEDLKSLNIYVEKAIKEQSRELRERLRDMTRQRDEALRAEVAKDEFLANMSHEIRTPLNAILGFVSILKKRITETKSKQYLGIIDSSGKSLLSIINDILDFSKIQSGKFGIVKTAVNPVVELSHIVLLFASKAYEKNLIYSVYIDPNMPKSINVDMVRVKQIISNLLSNAIKFSKEDGEIKVKITISSSNILVSVQDNGIGISKQNREKIFSAFEQADGSTTRKYGGTGLGLSISSKLATLMDGELTFVSEPDFGSTFSLKVPIQILNNLTLNLIDIKLISNCKFAILNSSTTNTTQSKLMKKYLNDFGIINVIELNSYTKDGYDILFFIPNDDYNEEIVLAKKPSIAMLRNIKIKLANLEYLEPLHAPFVPHAIVESINNIGLETIESHKVTVDDIADNHDQLKYSGNILVAEDNKTNQMLISLILDEYGIDYVIANDGEKAVEMFKKGKYNLILMDENMPNLNGIGAMKQIRKYEEVSSLVLTPVVALTASVLDCDKEKFTKAGMNGFVGKPINTKDLELIFNKYLTKSLK